VDPDQPPGHPGPGLVEVRHRRPGQPRARDLDEPAQSSRALGQHRGQRPGGHARAEHVGQQLPGPVERQVLVDAQVAHQRAHPGPVAGRRAGLGGEGGGGGGPAATAAAFGPVLGHGQAQRRQVEHLPGLDPDDRRVGQVRAAPAAPVGGVPDHLVGLGDLGQVGAGRAGLLAGPALFGPLGGPPLGPRGLAQAVRGRRLGGVGGVLAEPALQLSHAGLERGDGPGLRGVDRAQLGDDRGLDRDGGFQVGVGRTDRGLQDSEAVKPACPWATRHSYISSPPTVKLATAREGRNPSG
jgi:hypothetical protein